MHHVSSHLIKNIGTPPPSAAPVCSSFFLLFSSPKVSSSKMLASRSTAGVSNPSPLLPLCPLLSHARLVPATSIAGSGLCALFTRSTLPGSYGHDRLQPAALTHPGHRGCTQSGSMHEPATHPRPLLAVIQTRVASRHLPSSHRTTSIHSPSHPLTLLPRLHASY
jgi:hypothetical protein